MTTTISEFRREQQISSVRLCSASNIAGTYYNGPSNNGIDATLTLAASTLTIDGVACANGDRVLLLVQTSTFQQGIYEVSGVGSAVVLTRAYDFQSAAQMVPGYYVPVSAGTTYGGACFTLVEPQVQVVGVDAISFTDNSSNPTSVTLSNTGLKILNPAGTFTTTITPNTAITANRVFTLALPDAATTLTMTGSASLNQDVTTTGNPAFTSITVANSGLHVLDTNASHDLVITPGSDLTADRIFTITTGDAARTLTMSGDATLNQDVSSTANPAFASVTVNNNGLHVLDTNASHDLVITPGSDLTADRIFTITTGDAARTLDVSAADVTVSAYGATLVDDATNLVALATLGVRAATTAAYGGGGTSNAFVATGMVATDIVTATILASTNNVSIVKAVPGAATLTVTFSADPGAATTVSWIAIPTV